VIAVGSSRSVPNAPRSQRPLWETLRLLCTAACRAIAEHARNGQLAASDP
jgi:hypothetical protein